MRKALIIGFLVLLPVPSVQAQFLRRLFGGGRQVQIQQQSCYQQPVYSAPNYTQTYTQPYQAQQYYPTYQAVAAIPLATIPVAVDLQAYQYSVNATAFQSFRDYQAQKVAQVDATASPVAVAQPAPVGAEVVGSTGAGVLKQNCIKCHQAGNNPKSGFAMFDQRGELYANIPLADIMERITAEEPAARMPPGKKLALHEATAVLRLASSGIATGTTQQNIAAVEPIKPRNPFE
ncbi:MAG TPA: hypothetical protein VNG71_13945 [Pyrinomonadaceae bacterium]|nr:hypothetical protein [Pyrinomonadaceae bacterium]